MNQKLVFVHGFYGGKDTWGKFPELLKDTIDCEVAMYGFDTWYIPIFGKSTSVHHLAEGLLSELEVNNCFNAEELILVGHSLGGLVIRQLLLNLEIKKQQHNIRKVAFFAVPQDGSGFANLLSHLPIRCQKLKALNKDGNYVEQLNDHWAYANLTSKFDILSVVGGKDAIVTSNSSKSIFRGNNVATNISADHKSIVKPVDQNDLSFKLLKEFINRKNRLSRYKNSSSLSYNDWFKLDRHHELDFVQDNQTSQNLQALTDGILGDTSSIRLTGLPGLGKSRLIIESLSLQKKYVEEDILIFDGEGDSKEILSSINEAVKHEALGLVIVETCSVELHNKINKLVDGQNSVKVITLNFYHEPVVDSIEIQLDRLNEKQIELIFDQNLSNLKRQEIEKLVKFVEGFPLLADMLVRQIRETDKFNVNFTEEKLVEKLINGDNQLTDSHRELVKVISLFDYIKCEKDVNENSNSIADFINGIAGTEQRDFEKVITEFTTKELINRTGRFARVVPKPLALNLAMQWWNSSLFDSQANLIVNMPESLMDSFCRQITYLDRSIRVQDFVKNFCEGGSPFAQAELLLSKAGSRLFRALVEVNPQETSALLYRTICSFSDEDIAGISGDIRRNFVWALEMLVFNKSCFDKSAWTLFKLAQFENENFSNNSLGQFSQLFRWQLSGTEANFNQRLAILNSALALELESADMIIIEAIKTAMNTHGGTRTIGAEFQGTKIELQEWHPKTYQEIYDYWDSLLGILLKILKRGHLAEQVKDAIGHEMRGLIRYQFSEKLDAFIREVVKLTGKYWPAASQSLSHILHYDVSGLSEDQKNLINAWEQLLAPDEDNLEEKIKLIVLNPSREHIKCEDGHYIDMAAEGAKVLANDLSNKANLLKPFLELLMTFPEQKQSWVFARQLVLCSEISNLEGLLSELFNFLRNSENVNTSFFSGFLSGIHEKEQSKWVEILDEVASDTSLVKYYPDAVRTGKFTISHLDTFIQLIKGGSLQSYSAIALTYGGVTDHLSEYEMSSFCNALSNIDKTGVWVALDNLSMYTHGQNNVDAPIIKQTFRELVLNVSFNKEDKIGHSDSYHWLRSVEKLLESESEDFTLKLCLHLVEQVGNYEVDYSDLWDYVGEAFYKCFQYHGSYLWPLLSNKFIDGSFKRQYRLIELLGSGKSYKKRDKSIFDILDVDTIVDWCKDEVALIVASRAISLIVSDGGARNVNPLALKLIAEYGDNNAFLSEILAGFSSRSWTGSLIPYLEDDKSVIEPYKEHESLNIRNWARQLVENIDKQIEWEAKKEKEQSIIWG